MSQNQPFIRIAPRTARNTLADGPGHRRAGVRQYARGAEGAAVPTLDKFDPDRFEPARSSGRARYAYIPFGAGPRFRVGNTLGMMEATIVLATVARDLRLTAVSGYRARPEPMLTPRIRDGLPMTVHPAG